ncbi:uncharacterized protein MELLADRAFT_104612 [Melampsora larici-populina 98AG31]|uniref:Large ribosomal subunit protein mL49 n=1 Tax=Melampsora larici-populina (strain 98AG31 / pathotype 3-4-7) TaxID=747676 RepID=F4RFA8_MELLP|nr:uncharacterized protein MELLADRAFT_104612 [Melampsora larici-populina 98AG31]EGG08967.1 hypothetical protein MELLADRAFT_104612 [Melampsora larici-populina 98AG31]
MTPMIASLSRVLFGRPSILQLTNHARLACTSRCITTDPSPVSPSHNQQDIEQSSPLPASARSNSLNTKVQITPHVIPDRLWRAPLGTIENPLAYHVNRTIPFGTLPVYSKMKPALSQVWTLVKRVDGDIEKLKEHIILDFPESRPIVKPRIRQIIMRGKFTKELKLWLQDRGF